MVTISSQQQRVYLQKSDEKKLGDKLGDKLNDNQLLILKTIRNNPYVSLVGLSKEIGISQTAVENNITKLKHKGVLTRIGSPKGGHWEITINNQPR